jgi:DNA-binding HxlR family transcriptional regulator
MGKTMSAPDLSKHVDCPMRELITRLGDKWSIYVIVTLSRAPASRSRFSALKRSIPGISQRMLTMTLRNLERDGLLTRHYYSEIPPRVEYQLTALGKGILVPMEALVGWIQKQWPKIEAARTAFDRARPPMPATTGSRVVRL